MSKRTRTTMPPETVMLGRALVVIAVLAAVIGFAWVAGWVA